MMRRAVVRLLGVLVKNQERIQARAKHEQLHWAGPY